ncbi:MAG: T9SS type A sorting domain-containing protein, partial [Bacteroidota bacterium]
AQEPFTPRTDYVWARAIPGGTTMTLNGVMSEAVWANADSVVLQYGTRTGDPGSGYITTALTTPTDPANAVIKFLSDPVNKRLYIGVSVKDSSIGGPDWENSDGVFASTAGRGRYLGYKEILMWWLGVSGPGNNATPAGWLPVPDVFNGAVTVNGVASSDTGATSAIFVPDTGYVMEMVLELDSLGVDPASADVLPIKINIWDGDFNWPNTGSSAYSRTWWQGEWTPEVFGRVYFDPTVTTTSGTPPVPPLDLTVKNGANFPNVSVDGSLADSIWGYAPSFKIKYGDPSLLDTYPPMGRFNSNGWPAQAPTSGIMNDTAECVVKYFFKGDSLYFAFDVADRKLVESTSDDRMDAVRIIFWEGADSLRDARGRMKSYRLTVRLDSLNTSVAVNDLTGLITRNAAEYAVQLKNKTGGGLSTINNPGDTDAGYTVEVKLDLTKLGYTPGATDKMVFFSINFNNGNTYSTSADDFTTRTWWFHEWEGQGPSAMSLLSQSGLVTSVKDPNMTYAPGEFRLYTNFPNPFNPTTTVRFSLPKSGSYTVRVFDLLGRTVRMHEVQNAAEGLHEYTFSAAGLASGAYFYNVEFVSRTGEKRISDTGRMVLVK